MGALKLYDKDPAKWRINQAAYKKAREELKKEKAGAGQTLAKEKADFKLNWMPWDRMNRGMNRNELNEGGTVKYKKT